MEFSVGWVLSRSIGIYFKNFVPFILLTAVVHLPLIVYTWVVFSGLADAPDPQSAFRTWSLVDSFAGWILGLVSSGALIYGVVQELRGAHASLGDSIGMGVRRFFPVLGVAILVALCIAGGFVLLVIPGVILACMFNVAVPVAVMENPGVTASLGRSKQLTDGYKGSIFGMLFVIGIVQSIIGFVLGKMVSPFIIGYVTVAMNVLFGAFMAVVSATTYATLRKTKDGTDVEELARVFT